MRAADLWEFCLALYARPGVAEACLALQDKHGVDIPLLLAVLWHAERGYGPAPLGRWRTLAKAWRESAVLPLRRLRRDMKGRDGWEAIRTRIKRLELAAERAQLDSLAAASDAASPDSRHDRDRIASLSAFLGTAKRTAAARKIIAEALKMRARSTRLRGG
jgi:uncharacterized protein (TIGR02444 family)